MAEWIGAAVIVLFGLIGFAATWGRMEANHDAIKARLDAHDEWHKDHFDHQNNDDAHWTKREREDLAKKVDAIHEDLRDLAGRMYGDTK